MGSNNSFERIKNDDSASTACPGRFWRQSFMASASSIPSGPAICWFGCDMVFEKEFSMPAFARFGAVDRDSMRGLRGGAAEPVFRSIVEGAAA
jgi:hypothetical protein